MMTAPFTETGMTLGELFGADVPSGARDVFVGDITLDSRRVTNGALFIAIAGGKRHGLEFLRQAADAGAAAIAWEPTEEWPGPVIAPPAVCFPVRGIRSRLGDLANRFFGEPSRRARVVGFTGTNGKTTCAHLVASALQDAGYRSGYMGTVGFGLPGRLRASELTTADVVETHRRLAELAGMGASEVAMEVSSHALDQRRVAGIRFEVAVFTNLSRDHLDYHGDMDRYGAVKAQLFAMPGLRWAVVNTDDRWGHRMLSASGSGVGTVSVGSQACAAADRRLIVREYRALAGGLAISFDGDWGQLELTSRLIGRFNVDNLALALATLLVLGVPAGAALDALSSAQAPPGRMEVLRRCPAGPVMVVDYAHTPDALAKALGAVRAHCRGRLFAVFGCGGDRDPGKRAEMGKIASAAADVVILTDDNPRSEDGGRIIDDILAGMDTRPTVIRDRKQAITAAFQQAGPDDVVLVAGKGHEEYQIVGDERRRFSDREVARQLAGGPS
jgi:UDP-N-acetylmuramoyl-L-alanyl-D-glutamate--2,6-diaminopimelate ligase